jgi:glyceraldehyde 3-phosphate dehydrogenase
MSCKIGINGFGRIGRTFLRTLLKDSNAKNKIDVVAINIGPSSTENIDLLFKYDSIMGTFDGNVTMENDFLFIDNKPIQLFCGANPEDLPWGKLGLDWIVESSGRFKSKKEASKHISAGAAKVLVTAPSPDADVMIIPGINDDQYSKNEHKIISLGSCTTNCFAPLVKVLHEAFTLESGLMTTIHAYTNDQVLLDVEHNDPRRARAAAMNIIPTKTGASKAIIKIFPELDGKLQAISVRVPVPVGSIVDFSFTTKKPISEESINKAFLQAANNELKNILMYLDKPLVSSDFIGNRHSAIFDSLLTKCVGNQGKVFAWYDNEFGYSSRLKDFILSN